MSQDAKYYRLAARIFADFSGTIAIPVVLGALLGKWLDLRYGTSPRYLIILFILAFAFSALVVVRKAKRYKQEYERLNQSSSNLPARPADAGQSGGQPPTSNF